MTRSILLALGAVLVASAAQAGEYRVNVAGKSPAEVRASVAAAAVEVCKSAYDRDPAGLYEQPACEREAFRSAMARYERVRAVTTATTASVRRAPAGDAVVATR